jgi:hypothetical protein
MSVAVSSPVCPLVGAGSGGGLCAKITLDKDAEQRRSARKTRHLVVRKTMGQLYLLSEAPEHDPL